MSRWRWFVTLPASLTVHGAGVVLLLVLLARETVAPPIVVDLTKEIVTGDRAGLSTAPPAALPARAATPARLRRDRAPRLTSSLRERVPQAREAGVPRISGAVSLPRPVAPDPPSRKLPVTASSSRLPSQPPELLPALPAMVLSPRVRLTPAESVQRATRVLAATPPLTSQKEDRRGTLFGTRQGAGTPSGAEAKRGEGRGVLAATRGSRLQPPLRMAATTGSAGPAGQGLNHGLSLASPSVEHERGGSAYSPYLALLRHRIREALEYPPAASRRGVTGTVRMEIVIRPNGAIEEVSVLESSSHRVLDQAALDSVRTLSPLPFPAGLPPRTLRVRVPVVYELR